VKVLGLHFRTRHSWLPHIKEIKYKCIRASNVLRFLPHSSLGCNRKVLRPLYQSLIRSILDYGAPLYGLASPSQLVLLNSIQNVAIRICTGASRSSPSLSLCPDAGLPPLHSQRLALSTSLLSFITQFPLTSVHNYRFNAICSKPKTYIAYTHIRAFLNHSLSRTTKFNCLLPVYPNSPPWTLSSLNIILKLT